MGHRDTREVIILPEGVCRETGQRVISLVMPAAFLSAGIPYLWPHRQPLTLQVKEVNETARGRRKFRWIRRKPGLARAGAYFPYARTRTRPGDRLRRETNPAAPPRPAICVCCTTETAASPGRTGICSLTTRRRPRRGRRQRHRHRPGVF